MAKSKVKKAVKRTVAKKAAPAAKTRAVKTAQPAKAVSKAKAAPKAKAALETKAALQAKAAPQAKKAAKPAIAFVEPVAVEPAVQPAAAPVSVPKVEKVVAAKTVAPSAAAPCDVLTVKRRPAANEKAKVVQRADLPPTEGFTLLVDGHFKNQYDDLDLVKAAASNLLSKFPKLRVEIYDAIKKTRTPI